MGVHVVKGMGVREERWLMQGRVSLDVFGFDMRAPMSWFMRRLKMVTDTVDTVTSS